jgi:5-oxoprolinase (ATP-hydrolysing)
MTHTRDWHFWIDRGGTFTDVIGLSPAGELTSLKLLSQDSARYDDAAVEGIRRLLAGAGPQARIGSVKMGTTVATNALLERRGEPTVLVTTAGLKDAIRIGSQQRPDLFALAIALPEMLYTHVIEAQERIAADGSVVTRLDENRLGADLAIARAAGFASVAIVLLHGYRYPEHEAAAAALARAAGFSQVSVSHRVSPLMKLVTRGDTTLVDAYLSPVLERYVESVRRGLAGRLRSAPLLFMQSHGGLTAADHFRGKDSLLSGPAGGVVGMVATAAAAGAGEVIGFDMGGTSTDVSLYAGELERTGDATIAGIRISAPMLRIHTVAAGGGSILKFEGGRLQVGPESAGASPGPACYRNGGPLTITDANVLLGRVQAEFFPRVFGAAADEPLDVDVVELRFAALAAEVEAATGTRMSAPEIATGFLKIAVERMANAIKQISVQRGFDVTRFALCCFGGAAGQHACQVADALGIKRVLIHPLAGVLSAYGMGVADRRELHRQTVEVPLSTASLAALEETWTRLAARGVGVLRAQGVVDSDISLARSVYLKLAGSDTALPIPTVASAGAEALGFAFAAAHERHFGFRAAPDAQLLIDSIEVEASAPGYRSAPARAIARRRRGRARPVATRPAWFEGARSEAPIYDRSALAAGSTVVGPAIIAEANATTVIEPGWRAGIDAGGTLILTRERPAAGRESVGRRVDPILLEIFNNLFMHVAEQMGVVLENTAHSVNIKERLDFSCAVFDPQGELIANAPHIPVHLGSMGDSVQRILRSRRRELAPGNVYMLNSPYHGGTHLPDVTVVTPVFGGERRKRLRYVLACRAHHADIGGMTPGSMPPFSTTVDQEGVLFDGEVIVENGRFLEGDVRRLLAAGPYPARNPDQNIADLKAQIAANARGVAELDKVVARFGLTAVRAYMRHVQANAEQCVRAAIATLRDGRFTVQLDTGERVAVAIKIDRRARAAEIDFRGTSSVSPRNFNAPAAIVRAAVLYVFRTLVREAIPLNAGCLTPLTIRLPEHSLLNPTFPSAVVAGNVETSQCITDALLGALDACAASQGTMNNFTFGDARYQYYETICGGAGAGPTFAGASAVHTHMTNSRLTDPEVLEWRFPVRVRRFQIRAGTGGSGRHRGGDGVIREIEFLAPMRAAILSNRRRVPPFGLAGGSAGACGRNAIVRADGRVEELPGTAEAELRAGDTFVIETPGGGGYGRPDQPR